MKPASGCNPRFALAASLFLIITPLIAGPKKLKKINPPANPPAYVDFSELLSKDDQVHHALDRLTFGSRPGEFEQVRKTGLDKWIRAQLHPEKVPDNPVLEQRLAPLQSLRMTIHDTYAHYPPPQMIAAVALGRTPLPEDPELRAIVVRLANRYLQKRNTESAPGGAVVQDGQLAKDTADNPDLDLKIKLDDVLSPDQISILRTGTPDEKRQLLDSLAPEKRLDFVWALQSRQRQQLFVLAPVELRRELMLSVNPQNVVATDLSEGKLLRAIYSNHQLEELLVDFWYNHFNVFLGKGGDRYMIPTYERESIRPNVLGKFYDLLVETAKSPAMLFYLDNWQSVSPETAQRVQQPHQKNKRGLNENYGRELLELHTLGVDGGYTQKDVIEVARCFTGWTIANPRKGGGFEYNDKVHDKGAKNVLGHVIQAVGGMDDGLQVLQILSRHRSTAHFLSLQLAQKFVADDPPPSLVNRMAQTFSRTDGDLREVVRTMLSSPEFWSQGAYHAKVKTPFEMIVSAMRATNADVTSAFVLSNELQKLGEPLYRKIEPTGYSSANAEWVSSAGLLGRMNFALALAHNGMPGVTVDTGQPLVAGLLIGSPEFQRR